MWLPSVCFSRSPFENQREVSFECYETSMRLTRPRFNFFRGRRRSSVEQTRTALVKHWIFKTQSSPVLGTSDISSSATRRIPLATVVCRIGRLTTNSAEGGCSSAKSTSTETSTRHHYSLFHRRRFTGREPERCVQTTERTYVQLGQLATAYENTYHGCHSVP